MRIAGRDVAQRAGVAYKPAIDTLGRIIDAGLVVRFGRKYSAVWRSPASRPPTRPTPSRPSRQRGGRPPPPRGEARAPPGLVNIYRRSRQKFFGHRKVEKFLWRASTKLA